jgi:hypothetical protein
MRGAIVLAAVVALTGCRSVSVTGDAGGLVGTHVLRTAVDEWTVNVPDAHAAAGLPGTVSTSRNMSVPTSARSISCRFAITAERADAIDFVSDGACQYDGSASSVTVSGTLTLAQSRSEVRMVFASPGAQSYTVTAFGP